MGIRSAVGLCFHDWESLDLIRRIDIQPRHVYWSENGELVCLATESSYYILKFNQLAVDNARGDKSLITEDGIEDAFDVSIIARQNEFIEIVFIFIFLIMSRVFWQSWAYVGFRGGRRIVNFSPSSSQFKFK